MAKWPVSLKMQIHSEILRYETGAEDRIIQCFLSARGDRKSLTYFLSLFLACVPFTFLSKACRVLPLLHGFEWAEFLFQSFTVFSFRLLIMLNFKRNEFYFS